MVKFGKSSSQAQESSQPGSDQSEPPALDTPLGLNVIHTFAEDTDVPDVPEE